MLRQAGLSTETDPQLAGSAGILPCAWIRSRRSISIWSPRRPRMPSLYLVRASTSANRAATTMAAMMPGPARSISASYTSMSAIRPNRIRSARGQSSRLPASTGRIIRPGENHETDTWTAAIPITTVAMASPKATRRFLVINWRRV